MSDLNLKVKVEGKEQLDALWQKFEQGKATLKDVTQIKKDMNAAFKGEIIGTDDYNKFAGQLAKINDLQRDVRIQTKAGHEAYFKAGLEVRQLALSSGLLKGALGGVTSELANSVLNAVQLKQALVPLGISMGGVGIAIAAVVAILPAMIGLFGKSGAAAEAATQKFATSFERLKALIGSRSDIEKLAEAAYQAREISADQRGQIIRDARIFRVNQEKKAREELNEELKKGLVFEHEYNNVLFKRLKAEEIFELQQKSKALRQPINLKGKLSRVPGVSDKSFAESLPEAVKNLTLLENAGLDFTDSLQSGLGSVTQAIGQGMGNAFRRVFGEANSLLEIFAQNVLSTFAELLARTLIITGMKALGIPIPFAQGGIINEPIVGRGKSGQSYLFGEAGPEAVIPMTGKNAAMSRAGGSRGGMQPFVQVIPIATNQGLAVRVEVGNRMNSRGRIS